MYLYSTGILEMKVAAVREGNGIFHEKIGIRLKIRSHLVAQITKRQTDGLIILKSLRYSRIGNQSKQPTVQLIRKNSRLTGMVKATVSKF